MAGTLKALIANTEPMIYPAQPAAILFEQVEQANQSRHGGSATGQSELAGQPRTIHNIQCLILVHMFTGNTTTTSEVNTYLILE